jgi:hypothetical protein
MQLVARHLRVRLLLLSAPSPALAQTARYELFSEPDVRQTSASRTSAYVVEGKPILGLHSTVRIQGPDIE